MSVYFSPQLMRANFSLMQGLRAQQGINPASEHNDAAMEIHRTEGNATLVNQGVAPRLSMVYTSLVAPTGMPQGRSFQFSGKNI